ncbi:MAG TPA: nuclear transport factor 2 family protein, partial [Thermoleophilaceae bacterium]|nr:nuclear transport factor 2 family protein [Thermoleophilaceae bacterium]
MSQDNVEIVRRSLDQWNKGAAAIADVVDESWEPNADYYPVRKFPDSQPSHGQDEITQWFAAFIDAWEFVEFVVKRIVAVGDDRVLAQATMNAEGRGTGLSLHGDIYHCAWLRNGRILRWEDHLTEAGAL